ncbi:flagellar FliJ family protein [Buchnera aphidicola]|uniref:flagellar export protein FliJ n=1 Tax=Buchnera aphidicola TaxID=9 RepID=UPI00094C8E34
MKTIILNKDKIQDRVDILSKYKEEYLSKLNVKVSDGIFGFELKNYDYFITSLIHDISNQIEAIKKFEKQYKTYFLLWRDNQYRLKIWEIMSKKLLNYDFMMLQLEEQNQIDEYVQKSCFKRR